jgi:hypothetical protein
MNTIAETDDLVGQAFTPASIATLTPAEAGAQYFLTDSRVESDPFSVTSDASSDLGLAMATKIETDLIGKFNTFTAGTIGTAGSILTWGHVFAAETVLRRNFAPYPYMMVLHPNQWQPLAKAASVASSSVTNAPQSLLESVNSQFFVKQAGGVFIFVSANVSNTVTGTTYGGMFSRDALALDMRRQPRIEPQRDASRRGYELNMSAVYGFGTWRPTFGCAILADAANVTG